MLTKEEMQTWMRSIWSDIRGTSTRNGHPAPYPVELAERLIRMFSFAGDTILDPFVGTGSTSIAALLSGRNSLGSDIERSYLESAYEKLATESLKPRFSGAVRSSACRTGF
jgi:modification methylase